MRARSAKLAAKLWSWGVETLSLATPDRPLSGEADLRAAGRHAGARGDAAAARQDAAAVRFRGQRGRAGQRRLADARQSDPRISRPRHPGRADARHPARLPQAGACPRSSTRCARSASATAGCCASPISTRSRCSRLNFAIVGFVQPYAQYAYQGLRFELSSGALGASIKVGEFTNLGRRMTLRVERSENEGHRPSRRLRARRDARRPHARRHRRPRHLPRHRRSRHDPLPPDQRPAGPRRARATGRRGC